MHVDLTDLRLFVNIDEAGTITGGAERSHMTLASASERVRDLEASLGTPLLQREARGVRTTPAGRTLLRHARQVLQAMTGLHDALGEHAGGIAGPLRLLCNTSALAEHLPARLAGFLRAHPRVTLDLEERGSDEIADALRQGHADLGLGADTADLLGLDTTVLSDDPLELVLPAGHPLAASDPITLPQWSGEPCIGLGRGSALQTMLAHQAARHGLSIEPRVRLHSLDAVCRLVAAGAGLAVVPAAVARRAEASGGLTRRPLAEDWARRRLVLMQRRGDALPHAAQALADHLRDTEA